MEISIYLAQFLGAFLAIFGLSILLKREMFFEAIGKLKFRPVLIYCFASVEFFLGLSLIVLHNVWMFDWPVLITLLGWGALLEGGAYLLLPASLLQKEIEYLNREMTYILGGTIFILLGSFLLGKGLGLF